MYVIVAITVSQIGHLSIHCGGESASSRLLGLPAVSSEVLRQRSAPTGLQPCERSSAPRNDDARRGAPAPAALPWLRASRRNVAMATPRDGDFERDRRSIKALASRDGVEGGFDAHRGSVACGSAPGSRMRTLFSRRAGFADDIGRAALASGGAGWSSGGRGRGRLVRLEWGRPVVRDLRRFAGIAVFSDTSV